jgi:hypothetical protein
LRQWFSVQRAKHANYGYGYEPESKWGFT